MTKPFEGNPVESTDREDEDTIELELSAEQLGLLSGAAAAAKPKSLWRGRWVVTALGVACALMVAGGAAYLSSSPTPPTPVAAAIVASEPPVAEAPAPKPPEVPPVRFKNPFDDGEVFEFPAGTSESEARDAVAQQLLERAQERRIQSAQTTPKGRTKANPDAPVAGKKLAQRD